MCLQYPRPVYVGVDLSQYSLQEALQETGFQTRAPSLFICEGLVYYLPQASSNPSRNLEGGPLVFSP